MVNFLIFSKNIYQEANNDPPSDEGKLFIKLNGQIEGTNLFLLKNPLETKDGVHTFKKVESFIETVRI